MSGKVSVRSSFDVSFDDTTGQRDYGAQPTAFEQAITNAKGPTPGAISVTTAGVDVNLSQLVRPGRCRIKNLDATNKVHFGIWDPETHKFYPLGQVRPQQWVDLELSDRLFNEYGTGTHTTGPATNTLRLVSENLSCNVDVACFDS